MAVVVWIWVRSSRITRLHADLGWGLLLDIYLLNPVTEVVEDECYYNSYDGGYDDIDAFDWIAFFVFFCFCLVTFLFDDFYVLVIDLFSCGLVRRFERSFESLISFFANNRVLIGIG